MNKIQGTKCTNKFNFKAQPIPCNNKKCFRNQNNQLLNSKQNPRTNLHNQNNIFKAQLIQQNNKKFRNQNNKQTTKNQ
jgi:hypothetical protein